MGKEEWCIEDFLGGTVRERDHSEELGVDGKLILRWIFRKCYGVAWTGLIWLRIGTSCGHL